MHIQIRDTDGGDVIKGVGSVVLGVLTELPLMPLLMLCMAFLTPMARRLGERMTDRLFGPAAPK